MQEVFYSFFQAWRSVKLARFKCKGNNHKTRISTKPRNPIQANGECQRRKKGLHTLQANFYRTEVTFSLFTTILSFWQAEYYKKIQRLRRKLLIPLQIYSRYSCFQPKMGSLRGFYSIMRVQMTFVLFFTRNFEFRLLSIFTKKRKEAKEKKHYSYYNIIYIINI